MSYYNLGEKETTLSALRNDYKLPIGMFLGCLFRRSAKSY